MDPNNIHTALNLMAIGMLTVFTILFLVVLSSKIMIYIVNRFFKELIDLEQPSHMPGGHMKEPKKISAIIAAVESITSGKGSVQEIKRLT